MNKTIIGLVFLVSTSIVIASDNQADDDLIYGHNPVEAAQSQPADVSVQRKNVQQEDDLIYGYKPVTSSERSVGETNAVESDLVGGYE